ncbi:MAG TPA: NAD(P)/FAD-dependent oxidoreductase [Gammaproteobacteria bacterium]|nr:NAD(P)/FAD-dependent oxidoreductase [Gammaproteobacteria bacterium]
MSRASSPEHVTLVGAGLAGSLLAVLLARRGLRVTVYERRPDMRRHTIPAGRSINLALASRGIVALERAGLFEKLKPILVPMPGRMIHDEHGATLYQPYSKNPWEYNWSASRAALNMALMDAAEATGRVVIHFQQRVDDCDFERGTLTLTDEENGTVRTVAATPVIASDGAGSAIRHAMVRRGLARSAEEILAHAYKELHIPPAEGGGFRMTRDALHIWPRGGYMLIALPNPDGSFTVTLFLAREGSPSFVELDSPARVRAWFETQFPDAVPLMPGLVEDFFRNPTGTMGTIRCAPWHVGGHALLLGDAAHAIVPFHGQGMNCAFEDCIALDDLIERFGPDWERIFAAFYAERKPNAEAIADMALDNYIEMRDRVRDPRFHLMKKVEFLLEDRHPQRFIPRYSMVMFHPDIPYAEAQRRGAVQAVILEELLHGKNAPEEIDLDRADALIRERLEPLPEAGKILAAMQSPQGTTESHAY